MIDRPVSAFERKAARKSAVSATSSTVVNSPSAVSFNMTFLITSCSEMPSAVACSGIRSTLFGCHRARPLADPCGAGLLWAINGGRIVELHRDWAVIELAANGSRHVFQRRRVDAGKVTLSWIGRGRRPGDV